MRREFERYYAVEYGSPENYARIVHGLELDDEELAHDQTFFGYLVAADCRWRL